MNLLLSMFKVEDGASIIYLIRPVRLPIKSLTPAKSWATERARTSLSRGGELTITQSPIVPFAAWTKAISFVSASSWLFTNLSATRTSSSETLVYWYSLEKKIVFLISLLLSSSIALWITLKITSNYFLPCEDDLWNYEEQLCQESLWHCSFTPLFSPPMMLTFLGITCSINMLALGWSHC